MSYQGPNLHKSPRWTFGKHGFWPVDAIFQNGRRDHMSTITFFIHPRKSSNAYFGVHNLFLSYFTNTDDENVKHIKWQWNTFLFFGFLNFQLTNLFRPGLLELLSYITKPYSTKHEYTL